MERSPPLAAARSRTSSLLALAWLAGAGLAISTLTRRARRIELRGRVVMITGGARGLGLAVAREFARRGARLALCGRDAVTVSRAVEAFRAHGVDVFGAGCDTSDAGAVDVFVGQVLERFGTIDILINNAGQCFVGPAVELEAEDMDAALRNIFWSQYRPTMAVLPTMRRRRFGRIVHVTSIEGKVPLPHQAAYAAGKFAATGWSETLTAELSKEGIMVSTITPPPLRDGAPLHVHFHGRAEREFAWFAWALTSSFATSAERAARVIVDAAVHGDAERAVSVGSWLAARAHGLAPRWTSSALKLVDRMLPPPASPGQTSRTRLGSEILAASDSAIVRGLGERARADARRYLGEEPSRADRVAR